MKFSKYLKDQREKAGFTQKQLAVELGYSTPQFVSNWERGTCYPPMDSLSKLTDLLNLDRRQVFDFYIREVKDKKWAEFNQEEKESS